MFPISYRHQFDYTVQGDERWIAGMLRQYFATILQKKGARDVTIDGQRVLFGGRFLDPTYWGLLFKGISRGEVSVTCRNNQLSVMLELSFTGQIVWFFVCLALLLGFTLLFGGTPNSPELVASIRLYFLIMGLLIYVVGVLLKCFQFFVFMKSQIMWFFDSVADSGIQAKPITSH
jgi:hypothetical protein